MSGFRYVINSHLWLARVSFETVNVDVSFQILYLPEVDSVAEQSTMTEKCSTPNQNFSNTRSTFVSHVAMRVPCVCVCVWVGELYVCVVCASLSVCVGFWYQAC